MSNVDNDAMDTLVKITENLDGTPLCKKQEASVSIEAINMAAFPPNKRKVKKTIESEKLRIYFDLGKVILILVAIKMVDANKRTKVQEKMSSFKLKKATPKLEMPKTAIRIL